VRGACTKLAVSGIVGILEGHKNPYSFRRMKDIYLIFSTEFAQWGIMDGIILSVPLPFNKASLLYHHHYVIFLNVVASSLINHEH
jgi:hypothetical protein